MPPLTALYFPRTGLSPLQIGRELLFFDKIFYYLAAESDDPSSDSNPIDAEIFTGYAPVPFKDDLSRFRQLIKELKGNEEEFYSGQLSSFSMGNEKNRDEQSVNRLIKSISGRVPEELEEQAGKRADLWQARLLLKLAEILYQEELDLQKELAEISSRERELFEALKGEPEIPLNLAPLQQTGNRLPVKPEILVKAWGKLFLADSRRDDYSILVSDQADAVEFLLDANETLTQKRPVCVLRIPLPFGVEMDLEAYLQARTAFRQEAKNILEGFSTLLAECAIKGVAPEDVKKSTALSAEWAQLCSNSRVWQQKRTAAAGQPDYPTDCELAIYRCDESLLRLLGQICKKEIPPESAAGRGPAFIALKSVS